MQTTKPTPTELAIQKATALLTHLEIKGFAIFPRIDSKSFRINDPVHNSKQPLDHLQLEFSSIEDRNKFEQYVSSAGGEVISRKYIEKTTGKVKEFNYTATKRDGDVHAYAQVKVGFFYTHIPTPKEVIKPTPKVASNGRPIETSLLHSLDLKKAPVEKKVISTSAPTNTWAEFKQKYAKKGGDINLILKNMITDLKSIKEPGNEQTIIENLALIIENLPFSTPNVLTVQLTPVFEKALLKCWENLQDNMIKYAKTNSRVASTTLTQRVLDSNIGFYTDIKSLLKVMNSLRAALPTIPSVDAFKDLLSTEITGTTKDTYEYDMYLKDFGAHPLTRMVWDEFLESKGLPTSMKPPVILEKLSDEDRFFELFKLYIKLISIHNIDKLSRSALDKEFSKILQTSIFKDATNPAEAPDLFEIVNGLYDRLHQIDAKHSEQIQDFFNTKMLPPALKMGEPFTWESAKKRYSNKNDDTYSVLLQLSKELEDAKIDLYAPTNLSELKSIMDTLPATSTDVDLNQEIIKLNQVKLKKIRRDLGQELKTLSEQKLSPTAHLDHMTKLINGYLPSFQPTSNPNFFHDILSVLSASLPEKISETSIQTHHSVLLKALIQIQNEKNKQISEETKVQLVNLSESAYQMELLKFQIRLVNTSEGPYIEVFHNQIKILENSIFNQPDAFGMYDPAALEIMERLRPDQGNTGDGGLLRRLKHQKDGILKYFYFDHVNAKYFGKDRKDTNAGKFILNGLAEPLARMITYKKNEFFNADCKYSTYKNGTWIELLMSKGEFSKDAKQNKKFQDVLKVLSRYDIPVDTLLESKTLIDLQSQPERWEFFKDNFVYILKAAIKHLDNVDKGVATKPHWDKNILQAIEVLRACNKQVEGSDHSALIFKKLVQALPSFQDLKLGIAPAKKSSGMFAFFQKDEKENPQVTALEELYKNLNNFTFIPDLIDNLITVKQKYLALNQQNQFDRFIIQIDFIIKNINHAYYELAKNLVAVLNKDVINIIMDYNPTGDPFTNSLTLRR